MPGQVEARVRGRKPILFLAIGIVAFVIGIGVWLAARETTLTTHQAQMVAAFVDDAPLTDSSSPLWENAEPLEAVLIPQASVTPMLPTALVPSVKVRALHDGRSIAFLLEWSDDEPSWSASMTDTFADAAAIQFPVGDAVPVISMGAAGERVNIWHWKADWQWDIAHHYRDVTDVYPNFFKDSYPSVTDATHEPPFTYPEDFESQEAMLYSPGWRAGNPRSNPYRTTPVEDTYAEGFSTLESRSSQLVNGWGEWDDGVWRVVFSRPLNTGEVDARQFRPGEELQVAFAVWLGQHDNRGGRKQHSTFYTILIQDPAPRG